MNPKKMARMMERMFGDSPSDVGNNPDVENRWSEFVACGGAERAEEDDAEKRIKRFIEGVAELRLKCRIPTVLVAAEVQYKLERGDGESWGSSSLPLFFGDKCRARELARVFIERVS